MPAPLEPIRFAPAGPVIANALDAARWAEPMTVSEAALKYVVLDNPGGGYSGPWTFDRAPYLRRPMDCLTVDSGYWMTAVMGPSQCGKSKAGDVFQLYSTVVDPADIIAVWPDKDIARSYVTSQINKMIRLSPELRERQLATPSADNIFSKEFAGSNWFHAWPVPAQLRARPVPRFRVEDYDAVPEDIGGGAKARGEGSVIMLLTGRQTTFEGSEIGYVNSSPALGATRGIEALVAGGTDESWFVDCLQCEYPFDLAWERLQFDGGGSAEDAARSALLVCPDCGGAHDWPSKQSLMVTGRWVGRGQTAVPRGVDGELADARVAGFRITGLMGFASFGRLAELHRSAELTFEATQDEGELLAFFQSRQGINYKSRLDAADPVTADELAQRAATSGYAMGTVPPGVIGLTASVDVHGKRFEILVQGWGLEFESCIIDRFAIIALDDGQTAINPGDHPEHWRVLLQKVIWRTYPLATDPERSVAIISTAIDTGGMDGVTDNAFEFFYAAVRLGVPPAAITMIKGGNNPKGRLLPEPTIDAKRKKRKSDPDAALFVPNVHRYKNMIDARLRRADPGPGHIHLPRDMPMDSIAEITAEEKRDGLWHRNSGEANETWDLLVYNAVVVTRFAGRDGAMAWVPKALRAPEQAAVSPDGNDSQEQQERPAVSAVVETPTPPADHPHAQQSQRRRGVRGRVGR